MKGLSRSILAILVLAACGRDSGITDPSARDALLQPPGVLAIGVDTTTGASIETNKDDYTPGEVVHVVGRGWAPGETVSLHMTEDPDTHQDVDVDAQVDSAGEFSLHYYDVQTHDLGVTFTLTATGRTSGSVAVATFTDGAISLGSMEMRDGVLCTTATAAVSSGTPICAFTSFTVNGSGATAAQIRWKNPSGTIVAIAQRSPDYPSNFNNTTTYSNTFTPNVAGTWTALLCEGNNSDPAPAGVAGCQSGRERASQTFNVTAGSIGTTTTVVASPTPSVFGQSVTFTASVTPASGPAATGTVNFYEFTGAQSCTALGAAAAIGTDNTQADGFTYATSALPVGSHTISACYVPNAGWSASGNAVAHTVNKANVSVSLSDSPTSSNVGDNVTFTATVSATLPGAGTPTGTVAFYEFTGLQSCTSLGGAVALGSDASDPWQLTTNSLTAGNHTITACYGGDGSFNPNSGTDTHSVALVATSMALVSSNNPSVTGQTTVFTATVTRTVGGAAVSSGTVAFKIGGTNCGDATPLSGPTAVSGSGQASTPSQSYLATQSGLIVRACYTDLAGTYADVANSVTQIVNKASTSATATDVPDPSVFGESVTFGTTVTVVAPGAGTPTGNVKFWELTSGNCSSPVGTQIGTTQSLAGGGTASVNSSSLSVGVHTITVCYEGDANFDGDVETTQHTVNKAQSTLTLTTNSPTFFGNAATFTATMGVQSPGAGSPSGTVRFYDGGTCNTTTGLGNGTLLDTKVISGTSAVGSISTLVPATYTVVACYGGDANFLGDDDSKSHTVNAAVTKTVASSSPDPSTFGQQVTFSATVSIDAGQGAGAPTGSVTFYLNGACSGTVLGTASSGSAGVNQTAYSINVTSALLNVAGSPHAIRACFDNTDGNFTDSNGGDTHTVNAASVSVTASAPTVTPQYSDEITLRATVTPHTVLASELTANVRFYFAASVMSCPVADPTAAGSGVVASDAITAADDGVAEVDYQITAAAGAYKVTACVYSTNPNFGNGNDNTDVAVDTEDATVIPDAGNINSIPSGAGGTPVASFTLKFVVRETNPEPDANAGALPGNIANVGFGVVLNAVGAGANNETGVCDAGVVAGSLYNQTKTYLCTFTTVAVDAYEVVATVNGSYYDGADSDALSVYDPNGGFVTGGGKFIFPETTDRVNFGLVFSNPSKKAIKGNIVVIRHMANGDICRAKSNGLEAPAIVNNAASFAGKGNYGCTRPDGSTYDGGGNLTFTGWVQDNGQGSNATGPDNFWFKVTGALNNNLVMPGAAPTGAAALTGGNIQVPQPGGPRP